MSAEMTPTLNSRDETIRAEKNPHTIAPIIGTVLKGPDRGIM